MGEWVVWQSHNSNSGLFKPSLCILEPQKGLWYHLIEWNPTLYLCSRQRWPLVFRIMILKEFPPTMPFVISHFCICSSLSLKGLAPPAEVTNILQQSAKISQSWGRPESSSPPQPVPLLFLQYVSAHSNWNPHVWDCDGSMSLSSLPKKVPGSLCNIRAKHNVSSQ